MSILVWAIVGIAIWHFTVLLSSSRSASPTPSANGGTEGSVGRETAANAPCRARYILLVVSTSGDFSSRTQPGLVGVALILRAPE